MFQIIIVVSSRWLSLIFLALRLLTAVFSLPFITYLSNTWRIIPFFFITLPNSNVSLKLSWSFLHLGSFSFFLLMMGRRRFGFRCQILASVSTQTSLLLNLQLCWTQTQLKNVGLEAKEVAGNWIKERKEEGKHSPKKFKTINKIGDSVASGWQVNSCPPCYEWKVTLLILCGIIDPKSKEDWSGSYWMSDHRH